MSREAERRNVLENVARLERENAELRARIDEERERARDSLEETVRVRPARTSAGGVRIAATISFGLALGLVTLAFTMLLVPPRPSTTDHVTRGGSAGVWR